MTMSPCPAAGCRDIDGNPAITNQPLCPYHTDRVRLSLTNMPRLYTELSMALTPTQGQTDDYVSISKTPPLALNVAARALCEDMLNLTGRAEHNYRAHQKWSRTPRRGRELPTLAGRCHFITNHLDGILEFDVTIGLDTIRITQSTRRFLGKTQLNHRLPAPCPYCDSMALIRADGSAWVECRACGVTFDEKHYGVLVRVLVDANKGNT